MNCLAPAFLLKQRDTEALDFRHSHLRADSGFPRLCVVGFPDALLPPNGRQQ